MLIITIFPYERISFGSKAKILDRILLLSWALMLPSTSRRMQALQAVHIESNPCHVG